MVSNVQVHTGVHRKYPGGAFRFEWGHTSISCDRGEHEGAKADLFKQRSEKLLDLARQLGCGESESLSTLRPHQVLRFGPSRVCIW
jgi:hypothetical protein